MFTTYALYRRNEELSVRLHREADESGDIRSLLAHSHRLHESGLRIDYSALKDLRLFLIADMRTQLGKLLQHGVVYLVINDYRLLRSTDRTVIEGLRDNDVHHRGVQVCCLL